MHTIFTALASIAQKIGNAVKRCCIGIKNALVVVFRPIAYVLFLLLKGIYTIFKYFVLYLFIRPILFLYHHIVVPIGKGLRFIFTRIYKYIILPPFRGIAFVIKKIGLFFKLIYAKILTPIGHFFLTIFRAIGRGISYICKKIYHFITFIAKLLYHKLLLPIWRCIVFIFKKMGFVIQWISLKIYAFLKAIVLFVYNKLLYPIFYFVYIILKYIFLFFKFILEKWFQAIYWIFNKIFWLFYTILKFLYLKILRPIGLFIYHYLLKPIGKFLKFIFIKIHDFLQWLIEKIICFFKFLGGWIWKTIKFIYQCISVTIVVSISGLFCIVYTFIVYPFRVIIENKNVVAKKDISIAKRVVFNPYYLFLVIKDRNSEHYIKYKQQHPDIAIFLQIKNVVSVIPSILYSILFYPLNFFLILLLN